MNPTAVDTVVHPRREPLRGPRCSLALLTGARFAAAELDLPGMLRARGTLAGGHRSRARGRGLEFEEVRPYQAGDDIRNIDWRVTARSGHTFTKLFREERERPLLMLVDQRQPMFFGSTHCFKSTLAAYLGALIGWAGLAAGDRIGGIVLGNGACGEVRPRHTRATAMSWLRTLHDFNQRLDAGAAAPATPQETLLRALTDLRRSARPGSAVILISDFSGADDARVHEQLSRLARHNLVTALQVFDPLERELPPPGRYTVTDGRGRLTLDSGDTGLRRRHRDAFAAHTAALQHLCGSLGARLIPVATDQPPLTALGKSAGNSTSRQP